MRTLDDHLYGKGKKRILSLDGGGVRGLITLGFLAELESQLARRYEKHYAAMGKPASDFRLCDYFDLIGGTSTGGIIGAMLALGMRVADIREVYLRICPRVFERTRRGALARFFNPYSLFAPSFDAQEFKAAVDDIMQDVLKTANRRGHAEPLLDSDLLRTGVALVMKRIDTGSVWVLTNNKRMKYWDPKTSFWKHQFARPEEEFFANGRYPLGILARASASAPFLLEAAELSISPLELGVFLDGGATPFNNPAQELFLMTTLKEYDDEGKVTNYSPFGFDWTASEEELFLCSIGTGHWRTRLSGPAYQVKHNWEKAKIALVSMIDDGMKSSLIWLQALSEPRSPQPVDGNLGDMRNLRITPHKLLTFHRMNVAMEADQMSKFMGEPVSENVRDRMRLLDNADAANLKRLDLLGRKAGAAMVSEADFPTSFDPFDAPAASHGASAEPARTSA
jgi:uncharacterized protein